VALPVDAPTDHDLPASGSVSPLRSMVALAPSHAAGATAENEAISTTASGELAPFIEMITKLAPPPLMKTPAMKQANSQPATATSVRRSGRLASNAQARGAKTSK
jgi:hypothetical protein